jgi:hypothetical protein
VADFVGKGLNIDEFGANKVLTATATLTGPVVHGATSQPVQTVIEFK